MFFQDKEKPLTYHLINNPQKLSWVAHELTNSKEFSFDIENNYPTAHNTTLPENFKKKICGISFSWGLDTVPVPWKPGKSVYIPLAKPDDSDYWGKRQPMVYKILDEILTSPVPKIAQNGKFDVKEIYTYLDITVKEFTFDTMLAHSLIDEERIYSSHALKSDFGNNGQILKMGMSDFYLDTSASQFKEDLDSSLDFYDPYYRRYSKVPLDVLYLYGCSDSDYTLCLKHILDKKLKEENMEWVFHNLVMKLQHRLMLMELHGIPVDIEWAKQVKIEQTQIASFHAENIYKLSNKKFDIGSPTQLGRVLFEDMQLPNGRKNKQGWVTDSEKLKEINHPIAEEILKWRRSDKIVGSFVDPALQGIVEITNEGRVGWVHTSYYQDSLTGRLKGSDPNLTALPRPENGGDIVKSIFAGGDDYKFIFKDYSQIELRMIAHCSNEPLWIEGFKAGLDMHAKMAQRIWHQDKSVEEVKKHHADDRSKAKAVNFGIAFGKSIYTLSQDLGISYEEAEYLINTEYFGAAPVLKQWIDGVHEFARVYGYVYNIFGRRRHLPNAQIEVPDGLPWPRKGERPRCYRNSPGFEYLGFDYEDLYNIDEVTIKNQIRIKCGDSWQRCLGCPFVRSCVVNTEVRRVAELVGKALRQAVNAPIQGGATDMLSLALTQVGEEIDSCNYNAAPVLHIHDEMVVYCHVNDIEPVNKIMDFYMTENMEKFIQFKVPLTVDTAIVQRWSSKHDHD